MGDLFHKTAQMVSRWVGRPAAFLLAFLTVVIWGATGPLFDFSDTWQLVINTGTTIVTFLMVFMIQNTQNREAQEIHLKLDELIRATSQARNKLINLEHLSDHELDLLHDEFCRLHDENEDRIEKIETVQKHRRSKRGR